MKTLLLSLLCVALLGGCNEKPTDAQQRKPMYTIRQKAPGLGTSEWTTYEQIRQKDGFTCFVTPEGKTVCIKGGAIQIIDNKTLNPKP